MLCKCGQENLAFTNSGISVTGVIGGGFDSPGGIVSGGGTTLMLVEFCQLCGVRIFEPCKACLHLHPTGSVFCPVTGKNIERFTRDELAKIEEVETRNKKLLERDALEQARLESLCKVYEAARKEQSNKYNLVVGILLSALAAAVIAFLVALWIYFHSYKSVVFGLLVSTYVFVKALNYIIKALIEIPAEIKAWGPK